LRFLTYIVDGEALFTPYVVQMTLSEVAAAPEGRDPAIFFVVHSHQYFAASHYHDLHRLL